MVQLAISPSFTTPSLLLSLALVAYLLAGEPLLGKRSYDRLTRSREHDPRALVRFYGLTLAAEWSMAAVVVMIVLLSPGIDPADVGVRGMSAQQAGMIASFALPVAIGLLASTLVLRRRAARGLPVPGQNAFIAMLPRTGRERALALAVAISAGLCEELVYRGFLIALAVGLFDLPIFVAAVVACAIFGLAHIYQGLSGTLLTTAAGGMFAILYVATGSLLLPIVLHVLIDIRGLLLVPPPSRSTPSPP